MIYKNRICAWVLSEAPKVSLHFCKLLIINHYKRIRMAVGWKNRWQNWIFPHHPSSIPLSFFFSLFLHRESCILSRKNGIMVCENDRENYYYQYLAKKRCIPRYFLPTMMWAFPMVCTLLWRVGEGNVISRNTRAGVSRARVRAPSAPPKVLAN